MNAPIHAALMDRTYRHQRRIYDATRAYFLLGRDHLIAQLAPPEGGRVLEIACGTVWRGLNAFLTRFHVAPRGELPDTLRAFATRCGLRLQITDLHGSYAQHAIIGP